MTYLYISLGWVLLSLINIGLLKIINKWFKGIVVNSESALSFFIFMSPFGFLVCLMCLVALPISIILVKFNFDKFISKSLQWINK